MVDIIVNDDFFSLVLKFDNVLFLLSNQALKNKKKIKNFWIKNDFFKKNQKLKGFNIYNLESMRTTINISSKVPKSQSFSTPFPSRPLFVNFTIPNKLNLQFCSVKVKNR